LTENQTSTFVMHGARDAIASGMTHMEKQVEELEKAVIDNPGLAFDLARTLVECTCRTILKEREIEYTHRDDLPKLFGKVKDNLPVLPVESSNASDVGKSLRQTLSGLSTAIQGICELRNSCGFACHGSESARPLMEDAQALMVAETADTIIGFLYRMHIQDRTTEPLVYEKNQDFNNSLDAEYEDGIWISGSEFRPSEVLFTMEPATYRIYLAEFNSESDTLSTNEDGDTS